MSINERISLLEEQVANILRTYDVLIAQHEKLSSQHIDLRKQHEALKAEVAQHHADTEASINLLCSLIGILPDHLSKNLNLLDFKGLLQKRVNEQSN